jgi:anthranilate synthase component 1
MKAIITPLEIGLPPFELYARLRRSHEVSFLLESAVGPEKVVAYSFLGAGPKSVVVGQRGKMSGIDGLSHLQEAPLKYLEAAVAGMSTEDRAFPLMGGLVGYLSYSSINDMEAGARVRPHTDFPDLEMGLYDEVIVYDHGRFQAYHVSTGGFALLEKIKDLPAGAMAPLRLGDFSSDTSAIEFQRNVEKAKEAIFAGEAFQLVVSRELSAPIKGDALNLYAALRRLNPSPYMYFLDFGSRQVLGSSPETLVSVRGNQVTTYPIAGTRPIGASKSETRRLRQEMLADEKERAEHCMLVDLSRNDLGRICAPGSVVVEEFMQVQEFSHVQHLVSKVSGHLMPGRGALDALAATFPAGTVSGAPKVRAMNIIDSLEGSPRGVYAGAVGYLSCSGDLDTAIAIRSAFVADGRIRFRAGAGIVADSVPEKEFLETEAKMGALLAAARAAGAVA